MKRHNWDKQLRTIFAAGSVMEVWPMGNYDEFIMHPPPAGEGWGGGSKVKIMTFGSIDVVLLDCSISPTDNAAKLFF